MKKLGLIITLVVFGFSAVFVYGQSASQQATPNNSQKVRELNDKIAELEQKVSSLRSQGDSIANQIAAMDSQITLSEYRIDATQRELMDVTLDIDAAGKRMQNLEGSLTEVTEVLLNRIVATYQAGSGDEFQLLMASDNLDDMISRANYLRAVQSHDRKLLFETQQARNDYANQKTILENKKIRVAELQKELEGYTQQLDADKAKKQELLAVTKSDEAQSQKMLEEARAQVRSMKTFATSRVGTGGSVLPPQASPDGWYYNQRDSRWGNNYLGNSNEPVWQVGCLATSMAMVMKKKGQDVTPATVAANGSYFFSNTAFMLLPWGGGKFTSAWGSNLGAIDSKLASGEPVIVGVYAGPYGTHFVVLKSGSNGNYIMNDPFEGPNLAFTSKYSTSQIFQYGYLN